MTLVTDRMVEAALSAYHRKLPRGSSAEANTARDRMHSALAAALSTEPGVAEGWRSMDGAPRDGSRFLAFEKGRYFDCWWEDKGYGEAYWMDEADSEPKPTHWLPLPAAPLPEDTHHGR
ncbi:MAG: DUF551 domain-containing protein [Hyphomicrobiales bacterium]|nr:MAG: DUF551 domain-containing protein [Hyphomicrobiales bacterium]